MLTMKAGWSISARPLLCDRSRLNLISFYYTQAKAIWEDISFELRDGTGIPAQTTSF